MFKPTTQITVLQFCNFLHENEILRRINSHGSNTRIRACFTYSIFLLPAQCWILRLNYVLLLNYFIIVPSEHLKKHGLCFVLPFKIHIFVYYFGIWRWYYHILYVGWSALKITYHLRQYVKSHMVHNFCT